MKMLGERFLTSVRNDSKVNASVISNVVRDLSLLLFSKEITNRECPYLFPLPHAGEDEGGGCCVLFAAPRSPHDQAGSGAPAGESPRHSRGAPLLATRNRRGHRRALARLRALPDSKNRRHRRSRLKTSRPR